MTDKQWENHEMIDQLQKTWETNQPKLTERDWLDIFPEAIPLVKRQTKEKINAIKQKLKDLDEEVREVRNDQQLEPATRSWRLEICAAERAKYEKDLKQYQYLFLTTSGVSPRHGDLTANDTIRAKEVPLVSLIQTRQKRSGGRAVALCPFHDEKSPSFTIYNNNTFYCFGCNTGGDVIDFVQKQQNLGFQDAVRFLIK